MKNLTQSLLINFVLCLFTFATFAQYDVKDGMVKHDGELVPSVLINVNYDNLPRLQYAWENYLERRLNINSDGVVITKSFDTLLAHNKGIPTTNFTHYPADFYTEFAQNDTAIQMSVYAELGKHYYISPYNNKKAYNEMKDFTTNFLGDFAHKQKKQRMSELQLRIDYLQQEMLKSQTQNQAWENSIKKLEAKIADDKTKKQQLEIRLKTYAKHIKQLNKALQYEIKTLKKLLKENDQIPSTLTVPKS